MYELCTTVCITNYNKICTWRWWWTQQRRRWRRWRQRRQRRQREKIQMNWLGNFGDHIFFVDVLCFCCWFSALSAVDDSFSFLFILVISSSSRRRSWANRTFLMADDGWITIEYDGDGHDLTELVFFGYFIWRNVCHIGPDSTVVGEKSELE